MDCYIIDRKLSQKEIDLLASSNGFKVFYLSEQFANQYSNSTSLTELSELEKKQINYDILDEILTTSELEVEGQPILELLKIDQFNLWFYHKFRLYFDIRNAFYDIEKIRKSEKSFDQVTVFTGNNFVDAYSGFGSNTVIEYFAPTSKTDIVSLLHFMVTSALRLVKGWLVFKRFDNHKLIVDNRGHYKNMIDVSGETEIYENSYLGYLLDKFKGRKTALLDVLTIPKFDGKSKFRFSWKFISNTQNRNRIYEEPILFTSFLKSETRKQRKVASSLLLGKLDIMLKSTNLSPIQRLIFWRLKTLHKSTMLYYFKYIAYSDFFGAKNFPMIASIDEYSANLKMIHDAAKANDMESIGIQHGSMHELHPGYVYSKEEAITNPFPNQTVLWGDRWRSFLEEKGNYPASSLTICGQIRTDVIPNLISRKEDIKTNIGLPNKKILLFASQPQRDSKLRRQTALDIFMGTGDLENILLVLKPHPLETDLTYFKSIAKEAGVSNYRIITTVDLYQLLTISDYVVTSFSTVGTEAVYFKKPLIIYDPLDQDVMNYIQDGVGIQAKNSNDMKFILTKLEEGKLTINETNQNQFIKENALEIDGKVCERISTTMQL